MDSVYQILLDMCIWQVPCLTFYNEAAVPAHLVMIAHIFLMFLCIFKCQKSLMTNIGEG